jgi:voltage-gated potassium channel
VTLALLTASAEVRAMNQEQAEEAPRGNTLRARMHQVVFEADTPAGRAFDVTVICLILLSILIVSIETVPGLTAETRNGLRIMEWFFTALFTIEYVLRLWTVRRPLYYARSFFGVVDLLAILPTWISIFVPGAQALLVVRALRLLRIFRILKLARFLTEARTLSNALRSSARKITVFLLSVATIVVIMGSVMFVVEGPENGFTSIPISMYWTIVTLTTVGYGDIAPQTALGQSIASLVMIMGYGIIAVPTGIVTAELAYAHSEHVVSTQACPDCGIGGHEAGAKYCRNCGSAL